MAPESSQPIRTKDFSQSCARLIISHNEALESFAALGVDQHGKARQRERQANELSQ